MAEGIKNSVTVSDVTSYLAEVFKSQKISSGVRCYRGQSNKAWSLKPSVMRNLRPDAENRIFSELILEAPNEFSSDKSMFEKLVRAQHYSLPTRLLDVSLNPLVGLYFACNEREHHDKDGVVNIFDFLDHRVKFADSDAVSLICNLTRLSDAERKELVSKYKDEVKGGKSEVEEYREMPEMKRLTQFVRIEKPYFLDSVEPSDLFRYFFVYPAKNNKRVIAQSGAFVAAGLLRFSSPERSAGFGLKKIIIPHDCKDNILDQLDEININSRTMFPEIEFASQYIKQKWMA